jgi:3-deoxy-D-manno-octulosonic acid (KDO) 8-phosphate synthase
MAQEYKELSKLTLDEQEDILRTMSQSYFPIEINDKVFMIPEEVNNLINRLVERLEKNGHQVNIGDIFGDAND